jgi:excisionase family DNA binding protein
MHSPEEAAELLGVSRTTVFMLMKSGDLHRIHIGRSSRISEAELVRFVMDRDRRESPQPSGPAYSADGQSSLLNGSNRPQASA